MGQLVVKSTFAIHEVVVLTGFSKHMLDYLAREDIYRPEPSGPVSRGRRRQYTYRDLVLLKALHAVCAGKGKIRHLKDALAALRVEVGPITPGERVDRLLFVQGDELCLRTSSEGGRQLRTGQMTLAFVIDLKAVSHQLSQVVFVDKRSGCVGLQPATAAQAEAERMRNWTLVLARRQASPGVGL